MTVSGGSGGGAVVLPANHGGATVGLGWPRDSCGDISAGDEGAGRPRDGRPRGAAAGAPPSRSSLRHDRRRCLQRGEGGVRRNNGKTAGRSLRTRPRGRGSGSGVRLRERGRGKAAEDVASMDVAARTAASDMAADEAVGEGGRGPSLWTRPWYDRKSRRLCRRGCAGRTAVGDVASNG